jgi:hypothetical protein
MNYEWDLYALVSLAALAAVPGLLLGLAVRRRARTGFGRIAGSAITAGSAVIAAYLLFAAAVGVFVPLVGAAYCTITGC